MVEPQMMLQQTKRREPLRKRVSNLPAVQKTVGFAAAQYLRLVWMTNRITIEPSDVYTRVDQHMPVILAMWHGQHYLTSFIRRANRAKVLISRHRDGEINAIVAERLGVGTVRGSGAHGGDFTRKGGVSAFKEMLTALEEGYALALTADVPKVARVAGRGIVMLARMSGRPILPVAVATSRRVELDNWDRTAVNLPFGRAAAVASEMLSVPRDADDAVIEACRLEVETRLNAATARAYAIVDRRPG
jgi:lysophospholipid acyltransferase (LPLAT)-like uncharacterized protein